MRHSVRIGPAGWSYKDWEGIVYPPSPGRRFDPLGYLAGYFDTIEVNSSFYRIPPPTHATSWVRRTAFNPEFRFTTKLFRGFTHEKSPEPGDVAAFRQFLDPLAEAGKLGALLIQYPWSFKASAESLDRLAGVLDSFRDYPKAIEVRHSSFDTPEFLEMLEGKNATFVNIDQPLFSDSIKPGAHDVGPVGYVRLHGRNYQKWFAHEESWERYDYLYTPDELAPWIERTKKLSAKNDVYVITNNHFRGQAIVNAVELKRGLGLPAEVPTSLKEAYPERFGGSRS